MESIKKGVAAARSGFSNLAKDQKLVPPKSSWIQFGGTRPGIVPAGTDGSANDVLVYDNVAAIVDNGGKPGQLVIGTLIHVDQGWRVIDLPKGEASEGFFVPAPARPQQSPTQITEGIDERVQKLINDLEKLDQNLLASQPTDRAKLHAQRADLLEQLAEHAGNDNERRSWIRQFADTVSAAVQSGEYPDGIERLRKILDKVNAPTEPKDLVACVRFRLLTAENGQKMSQPNVDFPKLHAQWVTDLESFVKEFPKSEETADAMLQLGLAQEFSGKDQDAVSWYSRITADFPDVPHAKKAAGAKRRLEAVGTPFELQGKTFNGAAFDLGRMRGKVVLIHYWATWCEPCKRDMEAMRAVQAKYATRGFTLVGVNLDTDPRLLEQYVKAQRLAWPQLYEPGGLDSRLATEMGILTLPTMLLVDQSGRVVRRSIQVGELEQELSNLLK
jgi:thiol-disulfide isomerase/thioredoxin